MIAYKAPRQNAVVSLAEMRMYYTECMDNAMPGSRAWEKFRRYISALNTAIAELTLTEESGDD